MKKTSSRTGVFKEAVKEAWYLTLKALPFALRRLNLYFASYALPLSFIFLFWLYSKLDPAYLKSASFSVTFSLLFLNMAFALFITCYWTKAAADPSYKEPFWHFIKETVTPFVIANIKKFLVISVSAAPFLMALYFFIVLPSFQEGRGLPGFHRAYSAGDLLWLAAALPFAAPFLIQAVRLSLVSQAVFFDPACRARALSALKASRRLSRGFFFTLLFVLGALFAANISLSAAGKQLSSWAGFLLADGARGAALADSLSLTINFYLQNISLAAVTCLYFAIARRK